jgi:hypothetical protein
LVLLRIWVTRKLSVCLCAFFIAPLQLYGGPGAAAGGEASVPLGLQADSGVRTFADDAMAARLVPAQSGRWSNDIAVTSAVLAISKAATVRSRPAGNRGGLARRPSNAYGQVSAGVDDLLAPEPADDAVRRQANHLWWAMMSMRRCAVLPRAALRI